MDIRDELGKRLLFFDGAMGSLLQASGLKAGELPEKWNLTHPDKITAIHRSYLDAGADIILSNTFGANRFKYKEDLKEVITAGVLNARKALTDSGRSGYVALDVGPTGKLLKPLGTLDFEEAVSVFTEICRIGTDAGADLILIETMSDTYELKAAVLGAKEGSTLPVMATVIFGENGKMLTGASPAAVCALLEGLSVDAYGMNCGLGPKQMLPIFKELASYASLPLIITPNAGLPRVEDGETVYDMNSEEFAQCMEELVRAGASLSGGCCGTTPEHIRRMTERCRSLYPAKTEHKDTTLVSSYSNAVELGRKPVMIGERINPTGKKKFKEALREHNIDYILEEGVKQADSGAHILDVNVGLPEIDEPELIKEIVFELQSILPVPLQIDTSDIKAMEAALRIYNGKPMINSVNGKQEVMDQVFPLVKKYGGVVVALTLDEAGIPETVEGRLRIADKIYSCAERYGIPVKDIVVDPLTMTMSTNTQSALITLETVRRLSQMGRRTVLGVSNISFGLPQRELLNSSFFTMALDSGLSAGIINPNNAAMRQAYDCFCTLKGFDSQCMEYVSRYGQKEAAAIPSPQSETQDLKECIIKGLQEKAYALTKEELLNREPMDIIEGELIPALDTVGAGFEKGTLFLPQLLMSAEAAKAAFNAVREHIEDQGRIEEKKACIVLATVKGDIHDIGKNIVRVLLENYGYDVIDLGKDVPPEKVVEAAVRHNAPLVGLSALMTTTVVNMEETIKQLRAHAPECKVMVGGAVLTQDYADMIGADYYCKDAMQSVHCAQALTETI